MWWNASSSRSIQEHTLTIIGKKIVLAARSHNMDTSFYIM
jgi:hypothetical protein